MGILTKPVTGWRMYGVSIPGLLTSNECVVMPRERAESYCRVTHEWLGNGKSSELPRCTNGPEVACTCGFYAFSSAAEFFENGGYLRDGVFAEVLMWGRVLVHSKGFRAQYAYPKRLWVYGHMAETCRLRIQQEYLVPVERMETGFATELAAHRERNRRQMNVDRSLSEQELWAMVEMGDDVATKTLRARLSSAICTRRKAIKRLRSNIEAYETQLELKLAQRELLKRTK